MSSVDTRVVIMQFQNKDFEKGVSTTLESLDELDHKLGNIGTQTNTESFNKGILGISDALSETEGKFTAFETFVTGIFLRLGSVVADYGMNLLSSMTIDQVTAGYEKYENIVKNTAGLTNIALYQGYDYDTVTDALAELQWYADATSYDMDAMTSALLSFANAGIDLKKSVKMIMGLGNSFSYAGATATEMGGAFSMYAKAMSRYMDQRVLRSLNETYRVITPELQDRFLAAAVELNKLTEEQADYIQEVLTFGASLSDKDLGGWLDSDVMSKVFSEQYGAYSASLYDFIKNWKNQSSEIKMNDALKEQSDTLGVLYGDYISVDDAMSLYDAYVTGAGEAIDDFGKRAAIAATEAKVFSEVIDAIKDAVSSQYAKIFTAIFGDYQKAKVLFTQFGNWLSGVIADPFSELADAFEDWTDMTDGGRDTLIKAFKNIGTAFERISAPISEALRNIFGVISADKIAAFVKGFESFTQKLIISEETGKVIQNVAEGIFSVVKALGKALGVIWQVAKYIFGAVKPFLGVIVKGIGYLGSVVSQVVNLITNTELLNKIIKDAKAKVYGFVFALEEFVRKFKVGLQVSQAVKDIFGEVSLEAYNLGDTFSGLTDLFSLLWDRIVTYAQEMYPKIQNAFGKAGEAVGRFIDSFKENVLAVDNQKNIFQRIISAITTTIEGLVDVITSFIDKDLTEFKTKLHDKLSGITDSITGFKNSVTDFAQNAATKVGFIGNTFSRAAVAIDTSGFTEVVDTETTAIEGYMDRIYGKKTTFEKITSILGLIVSLIQQIISVGLLDNLKKLAKNASDFFGNVNGNISALTGTLKTMQKDLKSNVIKRIAIAVALLAASMFIISQIDENKITTTLIGFATSMAAVLGIVIAIGKSKSDFAGTTQLSVFLIALGAAMILMATALATLAKSVPNGDASGLLTAVGVLGAVMGLAIGFAAVAVKLKGTSGVFSDAGIMVLKLASAMVIMAGAIKLLADIPSDQLGRGLSAMAAVLGLMAVFILAITGIEKIGAHSNLAAIGTGMIAIAAGLIVMAAAVALFGMMDVNTLKQGLISVAVLLLAISVAMAVVSQLSDPATVIAFAAAILIISAALVVFAGALFLLGSMPLLTLIQGLLAFAVVLGVVVVAANLLQTAAVGLLAFAAVALAVSVMILAVLAAFEFVAALSPVAVTAIIETLRLLLAGLATLGEELGALIVTLITALCAALIESLPIIIDTLIVICEELDRFLNSEGFNKLVNTIWTFIKNLVSKIWQLIVRDVGKLIEKVKEVGSRLIQGLWQGISDALGWLWDKIKGFGETVLSKVKKAFGIQSPSKEMAEIGKYVSLGFAKGLSDYTYVSEQAAEDFGEDTLDTLSDTFNQLGDLVDSDMEMSPTITPVLDLSAIQNESKNLSGIFGSPEIAASLSGSGPNSLGNIMTAMTQEMAALRGDVRSMNNTPIDLVTALREALSTMGVWMDSKKVGDLVSLYQANVSRMRGA